MTSIEASLGESLDAGGIGRVLESVRSWAAFESSIRAIALVGSYARGAARPDSDVDLVVLSTTPERLLASADWFDRFNLDGPVSLVRSADFGAIAERRLRLPSGLEIEVGIGALSWAAVDPVDAGTREVVESGTRVVYDPDGVLARLRAAARG